MLALPLGGAVSLTPVYAQTGAGNGALATDPIAGPIRVADTIKIAVADTDDFGGEFRVEPEGSITVPQLGDIAVHGLTTGAAGSRIAQRLVAAGLLKSAVVRVTIIGRKPREVMVNGAVTNQGRQVVHDGTLLSEVIESAGLQPAADLTRVVINRAGTPMTVDYKQFRNGIANTPEVNPLLEDGDRIYIYSSQPSEGAVRLVGEVKDATKPLLPITTGTTVGQIIQQSGGITDYADRSGIYLIRGGLRIPVAYEAILRGTPGSDIVLKDRDEVHIPRLERPHAITVAGAVHNPSTYPLNTPTTLLQAVALAGGPQEGARSNQVLLRRQAPNGTVLTRTMNMERDADAAVPLQDGDYIEIPYARRSNSGANVGGVVGILSGLAVLFGGHR